MCLKEPGETPSLASKASNLVLLSLGMHSRNKPTQGLINNVPLCADVEIHQFILCAHGNFNPSWKSLVGSGALQHETEEHKCFLTTANMGTLTFSAWWQISREKIEAPLPPGKHSLSVRGPEAKKASRSSNTGVGHLPQWMRGEKSSTGQNSLCSLFIFALSEMSSGCAAFLNSQPRTVRYLYKTCQPQGLIKIMIREEKEKPSYASWCLTSPDSWLDFLFPCFKTA